MDCANARGIVRNSAATVRSGNRARVAAGQRVLRRPPTSSTAITTRRSVTAPPTRSARSDAADVAASAAVAVIPRFTPNESFGSLDHALGEVHRDLRRASHDYWCCSRRASVASTIPGGSPSPCRSSARARARQCPTTPAASRRSLSVVARMAAGVRRARPARSSTPRSSAAAFDPSPPERLTGDGNGRGGFRRRQGRRARRYAPLLLHIPRAGAAVVLLIACANVGNLLLVRASLASARSLFACRSEPRVGALLRQLITESLLLGLLGGVPRCHLPRRNAWRRAHDFPGGVRVRGHCAVAPEPDTARVHRRRVRQRA